MTIEQQGKACRFKGDYCHGTALLDAVIARGIGEMRLGHLCTSAGFQKGYGNVTVGACCPSADLKAMLGGQEKSAALMSDGYLYPAGHTNYAYPAGQTNWTFKPTGFDVGVALLLAVNTDAADLELVVSKRDSGEVLARLEVEEGWHLAVGSGGNATFEIESYSVVTPPVLLERVRLSHPPHP